jgi:hypothetical protein
MGRCSVNNNNFREITIPGDILDDDRISDGAKILYGKIARLSYKTGYCWASNKFLDGTKSGRSASRFIAELRGAGYICIVNEYGKNRKIVICTVNSRVNLARNGDPTSPEVATNLARGGDDNLAKNGEQTLQNITNLKNKEKETGNSFPDDKPIERKEDATAMFQKARLYWNERNLKPECRDIVIRPVDVPEILRTFQHFSWEEIKNAIGNYVWHKTMAGSDYLDPPPYGSLAGFLKTGVDRYFDDNALDQQFRKENKK